MNRDFKKLQKEYKELINQKRQNGRTSWGAFFASDYYSVLDAAENGGKVDRFAPISIALTSGFMIGYRAAKREYRKTRR